MILRFIRILFFIYMIMSGGLVGIITINLMKDRELEKSAKCFFFFWILPVILYILIFNPFRFIYPLRLF